MRLAKLFAMLTVLVSVAQSASASADADSDFANELHRYGIYGQKDYDAWLAKLACKRLASGLDSDAQASAIFVSDNLSGQTSDAQTWQFLAIALSTYCPDLTVKLSAVEEPSR